MKNEVFRREEIKYKLTEEQYEMLIGKIKDRIHDDEYGEETVLSLYYDTHDWRMIRHSIEKPTYREKLRLRSYGAPDDASAVYLEMKRKVSGTVYKRRVTLSYREAKEYLKNGARPPKLKPTDAQIFSELDAFIAFYRPEPKMTVSYLRTAFYANDEKELRLTFDENVAYRTTELALSGGASGKTILRGGEKIMEIKALGALPLWLIKALSETKIYPCGYSKYGNCYKDMLKAVKEEDKPVKGIKTYYDYIKGVRLNA